MFCVERSSPPCVLIERLGRFLHISRSILFFVSIQQTRAEVSHKTDTDLLLVLFKPPLRERERTKVVLLSLLRLLFARSISCVVVVVNYTQR